MTIVRATVQLATPRRIYGEGESEDGKVPLDLIL